LSQYATVAKCLWAISAIHHVSRLIAVTKRCIGLGYARALVVMEQGELKRRLVRYTGLGPDHIHAIVSEMTYASGTIKSSDLAFQPLLKLTNTHLAWAPTLLLTNAFERNLLVLLNRDANGRRAYARFSTQKEDLLRSHMIRDLRDLGFRFWNGEVPGWREAPDLDLAIIAIRAGAV
jgi:hypothetical protein